ncbi:MAG: TonB-dependent receptor [Proteobacteria bacterium]|nr:TonB-dependent receptor [Pseudomonadota bacterium]
MSRNFRAAFTLVALTASLPGYAVDLNATIKGVVTDTDGLPVPNSGVNLISADLLGGRSAITDDQGRYRFNALPPGTYEVTVEHPSFDDWSSGEFRVVLGSTVSVDVAMAVKDSGEVITVVGSAPAIDVESTTTGATLDARFLRDLPSAGRDYQSAMAVTPGVVGGGNANVHGGFDSSNQFYIDGVNTTDPLTNTFSMNMNYDAIDSLQIITGGMDAEYGRSLGGAVNIVTKSGGNDFEGYAQVMYGDPNWNLAPKLEGDSQDSNLEQQLAVNLGGPILKDKVWFFTSVQADRFVRSTFVDQDEVPRDLDTYPMPARDWRSLYLFGKITAQPTDEHRVWGHLQADPTWIDNVDQGAYTLPSGEQVQNQGGWLGSAGHQWTPSSNFMLETQLYYQKSVISFFPILWKDCKEFDDVGACTEEFTEDQYGNPIPGNWLAWDADGFSVGEFSYASFNKRNRASLTSNATLWADFLGEHKAKAGIQAEMLRSYYVYPGIENGLVYYGHEGDPSNLDEYSPSQLYKYDNDWESTFTGVIGSAYIQDVYKPHPRLTLRPGVRMDLSSLNNDAQESVFTRITVSPRFGITYDLTGDGKTAARAYYGRFYDTGFLAIADLLRDKSSGYSVYGWSDQLNDWNPEPNSTTSDTFLKHDELRNPYSDEFNFGISRELGDGFGLDATFIYEEAHNFWEDDEVNLIWNEDGTDVIGSRNGENTAIYRLRTPDDVYTKYTSLELAARKAFTNNWTFFGSYTWARAMGTNSADQATGVADIPEQRQFENGLLGYDRPHSFKMSGSYNRDNVVSVGNASFGYLLGWNFRMNAGLPYRKLVFNDYYDGYNNYESINEGRYRLPAQSQTDLRAGIQATIGRTNWMLGADLFNVFNDRTITSVGTAYDPEATGQDQTFGEVLDRQDARRMRVVLRGEF